MKKLILFAAVAGLGLISASPDYPDAPREARNGYPPCSRTVTDHCIQLYERGVRAPAHRAEAPKLDDDEATEVMAMPDDEAVPAAQASYHGGCDRCARERRVLAYRIRRAGERG
ncbi:MAG TPA: hypothetical protein VK614_02970 [Allosphingosinicella sp.]|nr:hypothetical protein [Allosphingosinicella sp.]